MDLSVALATEFAARRQGVKVTLVGPEPITSAGDAGPLHRHHEIRSKLDVRGAARLVRLLRRLQPDLVHAQDRRAALAMAALPAGPWLFTYHGFPDETSERWLEGGELRGRPIQRSTQARLAADAILCRRAPIVVAPSSDMGAFLTRHLRTPTAKVRVVPNGVALPPAQRRAGPVRTFVSVGSFSPRKAMPLLIEAFTALAKHRPDLSLRLIGDGAERLRCEALVSRAGLAGRVAFTGYRTDVPSQLAAADAFVLPSINENLPMALLEAMAAGLPCVATRVGGVAEIIARDCGILVAPSDTQALAAAMTSLVDDPVLAARLGGAAVRRVAQHFSIRQCADTHLRLWKELLRRS